MTNNLTSSTYKQERFVLLACSFIVFQFSVAAHRGLWIRHSITRHGASPRYRSTHLTAAKKQREKKRRSWVPIPVSRTHSNDLPSF